jgi:hypothetical protein
MHFTPLASQRRLSTPSRDSSTQSWAFTHAVKGLSIQDGSVKAFVRPSLRAKVHANLSGAWAD